MHLLAVVLTLLLGSVTCLDLDRFYNYLRDDDDNSSSVQCEKQRAAFRQGLVNGESWALRMLDAYGRLPHGITQGSIMDLGMFDQCLAIAENLDTISVKGKYCALGLVVPLTTTTTNQNTSQLTESIKRRIARSMQSNGEDNGSAASVSLLAACVPDACNPSDLFGPLGVDSYCQTKNETRKLDASDIACLCFFGVIACLVIASTAYDVYLQKSSKESKHAILLAFSFYTNGKKIFKTTQQRDQILCFNGLKVLSMFWVILGHRYSNFQLFVLNNADASAWRRKWYAVYALIAPLSVDTFLFISGTLLAYIFLKTMRKPNQRFNIGMYYLHRYLRITPALAVLYFFMVTIGRRIPDGPLGPVILKNYYEPCLSKNWWAFFLYVQNYVVTDNMCLPHTWYLSVDMQLYILSPLLLLPMFYYGKRMSYIGLPIIVLVAITSTMLIFYCYDILVDSDDYNNLYYYVTHTRASPWLIGLIFGAFLINYQANKLRYQIKNKLVILALWGATLCLVCFLFFYQDDAFYNHTRIKSTFFFPLQRPLWALCLCWISFACLSGNGGLVNSFLSASFFQVLSKITYSTYLTHQFLITFNLIHMRTLPFFSDTDAIRMLLADICISCLVGGLWTLAFESPILVLEKVVFGGGAGKKTTQKPQESIECNNNANEKL